MAERTEASIAGDVVVTTDVKLNTKGGSTTAILKKPLREQLGKLGRHLAAATLRFGSGKSLLLLSAVAGKDDAPVTVRQVAKNRFEIEMASDDDAEVDGVTDAFLRLKREQFARDRLRLTGPFTAEDWGVRIDAELGPARRALHRATAARTARRKRSAGKRQRKIEAAG